jgi:hypothetical protein
MNDGDAGAWNEQYMEQALSTEPPVFGTWAAFLTKLEDSFKPYDAPGDALEEIKNLRMGNNSIEEHIAKFKMLVTRSRLGTTGETATPTIDYFRETLPVPLQKDILRLPTGPTTLDEWYTWASKLDNIYRKTQRIIGRGRGRLDEKKREEPKRRWVFPKKERDPNAMDVDAMSIEKRDEMMKKGLCFNCEGQGHLSRDCPQKKGGGRTPNTPKKMGAKELYTHIRSLTALMSQDEKEQFYDEAEKEGF